MEPAVPAEVTAALAASAELGLFFGLRSPQAEEQTWRPVIMLYQLAGGPLGDLIEHTQTALGGCERRVAASLLFQAYAARLLSPLLGCLVTSDCIPAVPLADLRWRHEGTLELGLIPAAGWRGPASELAPVVLTQTFATHLRPLTMATQARVRLPSPCSPTTRSPRSSRHLRSWTRRRWHLVLSRQPDWPARVPSALTIRSCAVAAAFTTGSPAAVTAATAQSGPYRPPAASNARPAAVAIAPGRNSPAEPSPDVAGSANQA